MKPANKAMTPSTPPRRNWRLMLFLSALMPLYGFGWLTEAVWNRNGLECDIPILEYLHHYAMQSYDALMVWVTRMGDGKAVILLAGFAVLVLMRKQRRREVAFLTSAVGGAMLLDWLCKNAIHRVRPHLWESPAPEFDFGFPSGHATGTLALVLSLILIGWLTRWRWPIFLAGISYVLPVGFSRLYLGVHYPSDVLGAWALSLAWVSAVGLVWNLSFREPGRRRNCLLFFSGFPAAVLAILAGYVSSDLRHDNLRVLVAGQAYRSGQMNAGHLTCTIEHYGIRSILNLRGENPAASWYQAEMATVEKLKVLHYDRSLSAGAELGVEEMEELILLMRQAPKPMLIHCEGGADRSGLVSALYLFALGGRPPDEADRELSIWNGHALWLWPRVGAMDRSFRRYMSHRAARDEN